MARPQTSAPLTAASAAPRPAPASAPVTVHLVCTDDALWSDLSARLPLLRWAQHDSVADLVGEIPPDACAIALLDARELADLSAGAAELLGHAPGVVPVALVTQEQEAAARRLVRAQVLFELIPVDLDTRATGERLERASEEANARAALYSGASAGTAPGPASERAASAGNPPPRAFVIAGAATLALALITLGVTYWGRTHAPATAPESAPAKDVASVPAEAPASATAAPAAAPVAVTDLQTELDNELADARAAVRDKHYIEPDNDSALSHYQAALALAPNNDEARQGLSRVNEVLLARAETALSARDYPTVLRSVEAAARSIPMIPSLPGSTRNSPSSARRSCWRKSRRPSLPIISSAPKRCSRRPAAPPGRAGGLTRRARN